MGLKLENEIKNEIFRFNDRLFSLIKGIDEKLELDEDTFTIIENSNKFLVFCAVKALGQKQAGEPVGVIYDENGETDQKINWIPFGRSLAQYKKYFKKTSGTCRIIEKKLPENDLPDHIVWSYKFKDYLIYQSDNGSYGLSHTRKSN